MSAASATSAPGTTRRTLALPSSEPAIRTPEPFSAKRPIGLPNPHPGSEPVGSLEGVRPPAAPAGLAEEAVVDTVPSEPSDAPNGCTSTGVPNCRNRENSPLVMIGSSGHGANVNVPAPPDVPPTPAPNPLRPVEETRGSSRNGG